MFSVSRQTAGLTLLVSFAVFTLCCASFFERKNETGMADGQLDSSETASSMYNCAVHPILFAIPLKLIIQ